MMPEKLERARAKEASARLFEKLPASCTPQGANGASTAATVPARRGASRKVAASCRQDWGPIASSCAGCGWSAGILASAAQSSAERPVIRSDIVARFERQPAVAGEPVGDPSRPGIVGGGGESEVAEALRQFRQQGRRGRHGLFGIERVVDPRSAAVPGMNWAMPCAPAAEVAPARNANSCQISRVRKATGMCRLSAALVMSRHMAWATVSPPAGVGAAMRGGGDATDPMAIKAARARRRPRRRDASDRSNGNNKTGLPRRSRGAVAQLPQAGQSRHRDLRRHNPAPHHRRSRNTGGSGVEARTERLTAPIAESGSDRILLAPAKLSGKSFPR